jgi:diguanylate cyclase
MYLMRVPGVRFLLKVLLLWTCLLLAPAQAQEPVQALVGPSGSPSFPVFEMSTAGRVDTGPHMGVLVDTTRKLGIDDVTAPQAAWHTIDRRSPNFGFTPNAYWFRFQLNNPGSGPLTRYIEMPISFIDHIHLFHQAGGRIVQEYDTGDEKPFAMRPVVHQNFILPLQLQPGSNQIHIRLENAGTIEAPFRIWEPAAFQVANQREKLAQGMVIGTLLVMVLYNLFVYFGTRDKNYLYYICFALSYLMFQYSLTGYTYAYLWPEAVGWNSVTIPLFICTTEMTVALFTSSFLRVKGYSAWIHNVLRGLILGSGALAVLSMVLPYNVAIRIGTDLAIPTAAFCLGLGYWRWWRGDGFARLFCVAWTSALLGVMVLTAGKFGIIPSNFWTENAGQMGILGLVVLLSFTLVDRINHDRSGRIAAQAAALEHERAARASQEALILAKEEANRKLEQSVQERTLDLNATLEQLQQANAQLQRLSMTDGLTQVSNRASFDIAFADEFKRAVRHKTHLTLMLIDLDHFKRINDSWGHLAGDACLQAFARLLQPRVHRAGDMLARYGGEEFVVMLGETGPTDAMAMAESFRSAIEAMVVDFGGQSLRMTASIGVASVVPSGQGTPQDLLASADKALYQAKQDGRNRTQLAAL